MTKSCWTTTAPSLLSLIIMILVFPLTFSLPIEWSVENGPIEWFQVVLLAIGAVVSIIAYYFGIVEKPAKRLFTVSVPMWLLLIGRELSWGRAFYPNGAGGFVRLKHLWFGIYVYPLIVFMLVCVVGVLLKSSLHNELVYRLRLKAFPAIDALVFAISIIAADVAEHYATGLLGPKNVLMEELFETAAYFALVALTVNLGFYKDFQPMAKRSFDGKTCSATE